MTPEVRKPNEIPQNEIRQTLQGYMDSDEFSQHAKSYNTQLAYKDDLSRFGSFCRDHGIDSISSLKTEHINSWFETQYRKGRSQATILRRRSTLGGFLDWAINKNLFKGDPLDISVPHWEKSYVRRSTKSLSQEQVDVLLNEAKRQKSPRDAAFILIALQTGAKLEQIINLDRRDVVIHENGKMGIRFINKTKDDYDTKDVDDKANKVICQYFGIIYVDPNKPLFPGLRNSKGITHQGLWMTLRKYRTIIGVPNLNPSMLRNTYFENLARQERESA